MSSTTNVKIEPKEVFFYLDKLIRKIKIKNLNEYSIKFELLTVLNDKNLSPLQSNETQSIIEPNNEFIVNLEYKDDKDKNYDSIIILTIYNLINDELVDAEPIHVPFHFRNKNLVNYELTQKNIKEADNLDNLLESIEKSDESPDESLKTSSNFGKIKKKNLFKKRKESLFNYENVFRLNKNKLMDKLNEIKDDLNLNKDQSKLNEAIKTDQIDLKLEQQKDSMNKELDKQQPKIEKKETTKIKPKDSDYQDDLSICNYNQVNSLRYEEDSVRKFAKLIFLITLINFTYTIFITFFNPLNSIYEEYINNFNLNDIARNCTSWLELNQLIKNLTCLRKK